jgi:hypothetical protein
MGHSALWALDIDEGEFEPGVDRRWEVTLAKAEEAREAAKVDQTARREVARIEKLTGRLEADRKAIVKAMVRLNRPETQRTIREVAGVGHGDPFNRAWGSLLQDQHVREAGSVRKGKTTATVYEVLTHEA